MKPPRGKNIRSEKYRIDDIFHSFRQCLKALAGGMIVINNMI